MPEKNKDSSSEDIPKRQVTLRDIAKELGVSHVTVSLALRDHPRISEATRKRVKQKADAMGYHPDPMLSALSHYRLTSKEKTVQATLAWLNPLKTPHKLQDFEEFVLYRKGAEAVAKKFGFQLEEFTSKELSLHRMDAIFKTRSIRGILLPPLGWEVAPINWNDFPWQDYAAVRLGRSAQGPPFHFVASAQTSNTMIAFNKLLEKGYRRIGLITNASPRRLFSAGYLLAQQNLPEDQRLKLLSYQWNYSLGMDDLSKERLSKWLDEEQPDSIITDEASVPSLFKELGYSIPEDIALATTTIHDTLIDAGIDQKPEEIGRAAVRMLVSLINEHHFGIPEIRNQILVEGQWVDGSMLPDRRT